MDRTKFAAVIEFAISKEQEAAGLYEQYYEIVQSAAGKTLLKEMARMEREHERILKEIIERGIDRLALPQDKIEDLHVSDYLVDVELRNDSPIEDVFIFAIKAEQKAADLYARLAEFQADPQTKALFQRLTNEEKKHKRDLEDQYDQGVVNWN